MSRKIHYQPAADVFSSSDPNKFTLKDLKKEEMLINIGPQHPSTHGVLRLEVITDGEEIKEVIPHIGYLHRCFEKHAEALPYNQVIPFVDRIDYLSSMNMEHIYALGVEKMLGIQEKIHPRVEYIRVLVSELNRIASHLLALGTFAMDAGMVSPFLWMMKDREHILRLFEWISGSRLLYNYIWIGGLYHDLPLGFEDKCHTFLKYLEPKLRELCEILIYNPILVQRTANIGILPLELSLEYGVSGPVLRGSGLAYDLRRAKEGYSLYPVLDFQVPYGKGEVGARGDCWDRTYVRAQECLESLKIAYQCLYHLSNGDAKRTRDFQPKAAVPKKVKVPAGDYYFAGESPRGEFGYFIRSNGKRDIPERIKVRAPSFSNLSILSEISKGVWLADLILIVGSLDIVLGEIDR